MNKGDIFWKTLILQNPADMLTKVLFGVKSQHYKVLTNIL